MRRARGRSIAAAAALLGAALTTACDGSNSRADDPPAEPAPSRTPATSAVPSGTPSPSVAPTLDPAHAVAAPGKRTGLIAPSDIIVTGSKTLDDGVVEAIRRLRGVTDVEQIALGQAV